MKLLYITQYYPPEVGAGAVRSESMVRHLAKDGWEIDVLTEIPNYPTGNIHDGYENKWFVKEEYQNVTIHRVWVSANERKNTWQQFKFFLSFMFSCFFYALSHPKKYDLIFATSPPIFTGISGKFLSILFNSKFILEVRDLWPDSVVNSDLLDSNSPFIKVGRIIERWLYNRSDLIIPVTPQSETIIKNKCEKTPTTVIENGVDIDLFHRKTNPQKGMDEKYDTDKFRVGYVGSLGVIHDLRTFVKAATYCETDTNIEFVIVGDGGQNNQLQDIIKEFNPQNLKWVGLKKHEQIPFYISSFDIAINPVNESTAFKSIVTVKFYEYLACETPVINLASGALKEIGDRSGSAITLPVGNAKQLAETIKNLKEDPSRLKKLSKNSRSFVCENYSRKELGIKLSRVLKQQLVHG